MKRSHLLLAVAGVSLVAILLAYSGDAAGEAQEKPSLLYELRTYTTAEGRLPALHKRFREHTMKLFEKHGMKNIIYWTPADQENTLVYVIAHASPEAAKKSWNGFRNDPVWKKVYKESQKDGKIVTKVTKQLLRATDYSPMK